MNVIATLMAELVNGSPNPSDRTYIMNRGDIGLLASLDRLSATEASASHDGGPSIAAHVDHLRYGLSMLNKWAAGESLSSMKMDWTASWRKNVVSDAEWKARRDELRHETTAWIEVLRTPREFNEIETGWVTGTIAHVAYHFGAIRQIDRAAKGPTAEDEARAEEALRKAES